jgi:hypothetical protein
LVTTSFLALLRYQIFRQPISKLLKTARPEQRHVVNELVKRFNFNPDYSYSKNVEQFAIDFDANANGGIRSIRKQSRLI